MAKRSGGGGDSADLMRILTVLALGFLFLAQQGMTSGDAAGICRWYEGATLWAVPAFFMLCGSFALERGSTVKGALVELALPTAAALVVWSAVYGVVRTLLAGGGFSLSALWAELCSAALGDTLSHLWLLYILLGLYLVTPLLGRFAKAASRGELIYVLLLALLFGSVLPVCRTLWPGALWVELADRLQISAVLGYIGCYLAGCYLTEFTISRVGEILLYLLGVLGLAVTFLGDSLLGGGSGIWRSYTAPNVLFTAAALFVLFRYVLGVSDEGSRRQGMRRLGGAAMGIYLIQPLFVLILNWFGFGLDALPMAAAVPVLAIVTFLTSIPFALLRGMLPWVKRGEL